MGAKSQLKFHSYGNNMNTLCRSLAAALEEHVLEEKWVVCPSLRAGQQWLDRLARAGHRVINAHPKPLRSLALDLAGPRLAREGLELAGSAAEELIVDGVWLDLRGENAGGYLGELAPDIGLSRALHGTLRDLRLAGLDSRDIHAEGLEVPVKGEELRELLARYDGELRRQGYLDYAAALEIAIDALREEGLSHEALILLPEVDEEDYVPLERRLLEALPQERIVEIERDRPNNPLTGGEERTAATSLRWIEQPAAAPDPPSDDTVGIFPAVGAVNEVREVLRRVLEGDVALDEVEVLYTDGDTYVPLFYEELQALLPDGVSFDEEPQGATFADGIPIRYSRPGRALAAWLEWTGRDYPRAALVRMIQDGLLRVPGPGDLDMRFAELSDLLRSVPIHEGRSNYLPKLDEKIEGLKRRIERHDDEDDDEARDEGRERAASGLRVIRDAVEKLINRTPSADSTNGETLQAAHAFLSESVRTAGKLDDFARTYLRRQIREMADLLQRMGPDCSLEARQWLEELAEGGAVGGLGPRPRCLHLAPLHSGGHSGRPHTFLVGLDEGRFPPAFGQDPLLLDGERGRLSEDLPTADGRRESRRRDLARTLAGLRSTVTLSYSCRDIREGRDQFPSPALVAAYRILSGNPQGDQSDFLQWERLPKPVSFAAGGQRPALDGSEWWLGRLCASSGTIDRTEEVIECFPHLARGRAAVRARQSDEFTPYDGRVEAVTPQAAGTAVLSSSRLQAVGRCPLGYFFERVLGIDLPEEIKRDPDEWLDALEKGTLLHEVFRNFMAELLDEDLLPDLERDRPRLEGLLDEAIAEWTERTPPPRPDLFHAQRRELLAACRIFLAGEEDFCRSSTPVYLESAVGMPSEANDYALGAREPVPLALPGGAETTARGRIDRIDRVGEETEQLYDVWDYKTGSPSRYESGTFNEGRLVQHALYLALARKCLRERISPKANVRQFGYFFASEKGEGRRITFTPEDLAGGLEIIDGLRRVAEAGSFSATTSKKDCRYCDFATICRDPEAVAEQSRRKMENDRNEILEPYRELRNK